MYNPLSSSFEPLAYRVVFDIQKSGKPYNKRLSTYKRTHGRCTGTKRDVNGCRIFRTNDIQCRNFFACRRHTASECGAPQQRLDIAGRTAALHLLVCLADAVRLLGQQPKVHIPPSTNQVPHFTTPGVCLFQKKSLIMQPRRESLLLIL